MTYPYNDAYLAKHCTLDRETRAIADVAIMGDFSAEWTERLVITRTYVIVCQENQASLDDLFTAKLKTYRSEFEKLLPMAKAAADELAGTQSEGGVFSVPLERA